MPLNLKEVSCTDIQNQFGNYLGWVVHRREPLLIEKHGKPVAVLVDYQEWKKMKEGPKTTRTPWCDALDQHLEEMKKKHPNAKPFSAVELVNQIREEEENG